MDNLFKLLRFLAWYGVAVVTLFYLLPVAGLMIEVQYEALSSSVKFFSVIGVFLVLAVWQVINIRDRLRQTQQTV